MAKDVDYNSLGDRFKNLSKNESSYGKIRKTLIEGDLGKYEIGSKDHQNFILTHKLRKFNELINKGNFEGSENIANDIYHNFIDNKHINNEDKLKYLEMFNKRIERGVSYLEKNKHSENDVKKMGEILEYSKKIEDKLHKSDNSSSGLKKSLAVLSIGSVLAGIFFYLLT